MNPTSVLLQQMQSQTEAWQRSNDKRFIFLRCYTMMTQNMHRGTLEGRFEDPTWVEQLLLRFAEYYFNALDAYEKDPERAPKVWKQAHDASRERKLHVLQHLFLGINAHINYDLVLSLYDGLHVEWPSLTEERRNIRKRDHEQVNDIISETIDAVQDEVIAVHSPMMAAVDKLMGRMDEWLLTQLISGWRGEVWHETMRLLNTVTEEGREAIRLSLEKAVLKKGGQLVLL